MSVSLTVGLRGRIGTLAGSTEVVGEEEEEEEEEEGEEPAISKAAEGAVAEEEEEEEEGEEPAISKAAEEAVAEEEEEEKGAGGGGFSGSPPRNC